MTRSVVTQLRAVLLCASLFMGVPTALASPNSCPTSVASLNGWYGMLVSGTTLAATPVPKFLIGALLFDGAGGITGTNIYAGATLDTTAVGSYSSNADCSFTLVLNFGSAATQFYTVGIAGAEAVGIETDAAAVATIDLQAQYSTPGTGLNFTNSSLNGRFALSCLGPQGGESDLNLVTFNNGTLSGTDAYNNSGNFPKTDAAYSGTYSINPDGTFLGSLTVSGTPFDFYGVISNTDTEVEYIYANVANGAATAAFAACTGGLAPRSATTPSFTLTPAAAAYTVAPGQAVSEAIAIAPVDGFAATVAFSAGGLPTGFAATFAPVKSATGTTLSLSVATSVAPGTYPITVTATTAATATSPSITQTAELAFTVVAVSGGITNVSLAASDNVYGIASDGTAPVHGGLDGAGYAYSANLLGTMVTWNGTTFALGSSTVANAASGVTIPLPAGNFTTLSFLATAVFGEQIGQTFVVTYTDGTTTTYTQSLSDWGQPEHNSGESIVSTMAYRDTPAGGTQSGSWNVYGYSFALNTTKTVQSLKLPASRDVVVLAVDLSATTAVLNLSTAFNVFAFANPGTAPVNGGVDTSSDAYAENLLGTAATWSGSSFALGTASAASAVAVGTVALPVGNYTALKVLASGMYAPTTNEVFTVTYLDGTTSTFTQSLSSWGASESYAGESIALTTAYRITPTGSTQNGPWYVYGYSFGLNGAKAVQSLTLPNTRQVVVYALDLTSLLSQTITFPTPGPQQVGASVALGATASSGLAVRYTSKTTSICTISGRTAVMVAAGICTLVAGQPGNATYAEAQQVQQSFKVAVANAAAVANPAATVTNKRLP